MAVLRLYQRAATRRVIDAYLAGTKRVALVAPTGSGKTIMGAHLVAMMLVSSMAANAIWVAHTREILDQTRAKLGELGAHVGVHSIQSLVDEGARPKADFVVFDEFHHLRGTTWAHVGNHYRAAHVLGLSATPDGDNLGAHFDDMVVAATTTELLAAEHLVPCDVIGPSRRRKASLAEDPAKAYVAHGEGRQAIVFCSNVDQAKAVAADLVALGVAAECVDGEMGRAPRDAAISRYREGSTTVLTGCSILTEGFDAPATAVVVIARACTTSALFLQMVGRAMRPSPGKVRALCIDLVGAAYEHGLPTEDRVYSLDENPIHLADGGNLPPLRQCRGCGAVYRIGPTKCVRCGKVHPPPPRPKLTREELHAIAATEPVAKKKETWHRLLAEGRGRGFHVGWAVHRFTARYGHPPRFP